MSRRNFLLAGVAALAVPALVEGVLATPAAASAYDPVLGMIKIFAGPFTPVGYMDCNGQPLPISNHTRLFSLIGNLYGGNYPDTFDLPNLNADLPPGAGAMRFIIDTAGHFPAHAQT